jgi:hypothetical protein
MSTAPAHIHRLQSPAVGTARLGAVRRSLRLALASTLHAVAVAIGVAGLLAVAALPFVATIALG